MPIRPPAKDCLIFTFAKDGKFTIKKAYIMLRLAKPLTGEKEFWERVWRHKGLLLKFKLFIWKCALNAIPVQKAISRRIQFVSPLCQLCHEEDETVTHALFGCHFARAVWLASPLGIRSDMFQGGFMQIVNMVRLTMGEHEFPKFMAVLLEIWRSRNGAMYGNEKKSINACQELWKRVMEDCLILASGNNATV